MTKRHTFSIRKSILILAALLALLLVPCTVHAATKAATASNGKYLYFYVDDTIYRMNTNTGATTLVKKFSDIYHIYDISYYKGYLYFCGDRVYGSGRVENYIYRMKKNGTKLTRLVPGSQPRIYGGKIYYVKEVVRKDNYNDSFTSPTGIGRMSLTGKNDTLISNFSDQYNYISSMEIISDRIYYRMMDKLYSMPVAGGSFTLHADATQLIASGSTLYYVNNSGVYQWKPGSSAKRLFTPKIAFWNMPMDDILAARGNYLYYREYTGSSSAYYYKRCNLNTLKTSKVKTWNIVHMFHGSGNYVIVYRSTGGGYHDCASMKVTGAKYKRIRQFFIS